MELSAQEVLFFRILFMHLLLDLEELQCAKLFARLSRIEHCDQLKQSLSLFLYQFINKQFRKTFTKDLLALFDISKKDNTQWLRERDKILKKRAKKMKKVLSATLEEMNPLTSLQSWDYHCADQ